ncbi:MAG: thiamine pyrophosphate-binding protein [Desulfuromonadaceae bacterium]|nr:thiamine pyrophosphate-binding protein [Desulfuromonadaceae bacterium]
MIKVTDYIVKRLKEYGIRHVFMITGGGAMHLNDSFGACESISYICNHHEQASAMGAEGYARVSGSLSVAVVTSGPGGTNTLTGVIGQWLDSVPVLYLSGQVKQETTIESCRELGLRQLGDQEINIVDLVRPVTKFAAIVQKADEIGLLLDKALFIATHGRPGPVWLDIPLDIQGALIDESMLTTYSPKDGVVASPQTLSQIGEVVELLRAAKRPVFLAGQGIRIAGAQEAFLNLVERLQIPVVSSFSGVDLIPSDHPLFMGRIGTIGTRSGNFTLQNADLLISVGSRNNIRQASYNWKSFAREAIKIVVDIDAAELKKPTVVPDLAIHTDAREFLDQLGGQVNKTSLPMWTDWLKWCGARREKYPVVLPKHRVSAANINPYHFIDRLSANLASDAIVVAGNGTACVVLFQACQVKKGQRFFWNSGCASMGYDLPAAIGACFAAGGRDEVCLAGDGSLQMNIQEFQTVVHHQLPLKLFVLSNNGYISIRQTHQAFFGGRLTGCDQSSGVSFPDITLIAAAYGLPATVIDNHDQLDEKIAAVLATPGPVVCDIRLQHDYIFEPKLSSEKLPDGRMVSKPLEDMYPFLDRDEFNSNMIAGVPAK